MSERTTEQLKDDLENALNVAERALSSGSDRIYESAMKTAYRIESELERRVS